ncbi:MAG TPA: GNAT family N-acetyltransferase [Candidatus Deferrimicrobium sp.]|nr:GNAT family N-acetyltransferase [Candidatus Deferrimicrobium sp.]
MTNALRPEPHVTLRPITAADREWIIEFLRGGGADFIVTRGRKVYPAQIDGFCAFDDGDQRVGLITYEIISNQCEIVTLDALHKFSGIGTALIEAVRDTAIARGCQRLWLITTNDNLDAIRFYQRRGFTIAAAHINALAYSRQLKPSIPEIGLFGIPLRDEIEFEMMLNQSRKV